MNHINIIFFGSTHDSIIVLDKLTSSSIGQLVNWSIVAVVTQPPRPIGRKQTITPTPVEIWAKEQNIPVLSFPSDDVKPWLYKDETTVIDALQPFKADLLISACYGQKIPTATIQTAKYGGLNVHPSILPRWRGADPVPWAIFTGDHQTGVTIVTLADKFDEGKIIAQKKIPLKSDALPDPVRSQLFSIGANLMITSIPKYVASQRHLQEDLLQMASKQFKHPYARRLTKEDGYEPWVMIEKAMSEAGFEEALRIDRKFRAFTPWPGLWTKIKVHGLSSMVHGEEMRLKILSCHLNHQSTKNFALSTINYQLILDSVQLEGKTPVSFSQFSSAYLHPSNKLFS